MIALYILLGIIGLIILVLSIPVYLKFEYGENVKLIVTYLFVKIDLLKPKEEKQVEGKAKDVVEEVKPNPLDRIKPLLNRYGLEGFLEIIKELGALLGSNTVKMIKKIKIKDLDIYCVVRGSDCAEVAETYYKACSVIYPVISNLKAITKSKKIACSVDMQYIDESHKIIGEAKLRVIPITLVGDILGLIIKSIPYIRKLNVKT